MRSALISMTRSITLHLEARQRKTPTPTYEISKPYVIPFESKEYPLRPSVGNFSYSL
jgi:hypothetical protein